MRAAIALGLVGAALILYASLSNSWFIDEDFRAGLLSAEWCHENEDELKCKQILKQHGGAYAVHRDRPLRVTTFIAGLLAAFGTLLILLPPVRKEGAYLALIQRGVIVIATILAMVCASSVLMVGHAYPTFLIGTVCAFLATVFVIAPSPPPPKA